MQIHPLLLPGDRGDILPRREGICQEPGLQMRKGCQLWKGGHTMSREALKRCIIQMVDQIEDVGILELVFKYVHWKFVS